MFVLVRFISSKIIKLVDKYFVCVAVGSFFSEPFSSKLIKIVLTLFCVWPQACFVHCHFRQQSFKLLNSPLCLAADAFFPCHFRPKSLQLLKLPFCVWPQARFFPAMFIQHCQNACKQQILNWGARVSAITTYVNVSHFQIEGLILKVPVWAPCRNL